MEKCLNEVIECKFENKGLKLKTTVTWPSPLSAPPLPCPHHAGLCRGGAAAAGHQPPGGRG